jgi:hypothetical protein
VVEVLAVAATTMALSSIANQLLMPAGTSEEAANRSTGSIRPPLSSPYSLLSAIVTIIIIIVIIIVIVVVIVTPLAPLPPRPVVVVLVVVAS